MSSNLHQAVFDHALDAHACATRETYLPCMWDTDGAAESGTDQASFHQFAMDSEGHAIVVWRQISGPGDQPSIWFNRYQDGSGWVDADIVEIEDLYPIVNPRVAIDGQGNAFYHMGA